MTTTRKKAASKKAARKKTTRKKATGKQSRYWSGRVTRESDALDLEHGVFSSNDPKKISRSLLRSAQESKRRKATSPYRSAMSMLVFYINRAGKNLPASRRRILEQAKDELRALRESAE